ncbi:MULTISPECIES: dihydrolipoyl dehydrogenase [Nitrosomonas]|uniref:Dihydrolipoyl dehydrogenase n=1 Tax=Nitrosomonas communis TaxID=44574 RepID=A0A0F7KIF9_9PROT|nr:MULTISPECIES: dihydrolipoyl dehydrogenase [Nitrosomonas]AKH38893.1 dihydrolipoamide dehydrogenase [Nitrosomonas communis]TYP91887.1 dihydrolipoamide dehydrogenase [Nitrosomonas communis]UVS61029.1 dihydrolipoyl dehydrogenase [Nitrosomonas sp. PLL12]
MTKSFDVAVIGAGPGGYVAAIRCAQLGLNTVCIDEWKNEQGVASLGGTCLNVGCIPSKALLESSENYARAAHKFIDHGIHLEGLSMDVSVMIARKNKIVKAFTGGIAMLFKKNKVTSLHGRGTLLKQENGLWKIQVKNNSEVEEIQAEYIIIATGSTPRQLPFIEVDNHRILDNSGALALTEVPKRLGVIGAGVIGLEMGSVWRRLGSEVTVLEAQPNFLMAADEHIAKEAQKIFTRELGLIIQTGVKIKSIQVEEQQIVVDYADAKADPQKLEVDKLIVAIGRVPNTVGLATDEIGLKINERGYIEVDEHCCTSLSKVYAVGDVVRGPMLAHKASEEGVAVAEMIASTKQGHANESAKVNLDIIPWVIYTSPEIAWVGKTEQELKSAGIAYRAGQFPFMANGRARALGETSGFVKVLADADTDRILGIHMIGPYVSEMIAEAVVAMEFAASSEDIARIIHAHPSLSEVLHEAALAVDKRALHI